MSRQPDPDLVIAWFPIGDRVSGRILGYLMPKSRVGVHVDLGRGARGFIDGEHLTHDVGEWPAIGSVIEFEVLRHDIRRLMGYCQVRLWPLESRFRSGRTRLAFSAAEWSAIKVRHPVGSLVTATVTGITPGNRWYTVTFGAAFSRITWTGSPPEVGVTADFVVTRLLDTTRRIQLTPLG
ncbi:hypothetical protein [Crossiella sp. NPDC003009]